MAPEFLYKYRRWDDQYPHEKKPITENKVYFSSASKFNDPFDCTIPFRLDLITDEKAYERIVYHIRKRNPYFTDNQIRDEAEIVFDQKHFRDPENIRIVKDSEQDKRFNTGILSLTETPTNILMWSHYADSHKGFCLGYSTNELDTYFRKLYETDKLLIHRMAVQYSTDFPVFDFYSLSDQDTFLKPLITKSSDWEYEREHRYFLYEYTNREIPLQYNLKLRIVFGYKMTLDKKAEITNAAKNLNHKIEFYQIKLSESSYKLEMVKVSL